MLGIGQENQNKLSEGLNRLIIDGTIGNYVHFSININIHKRDILHVQTVMVFPCEILTNVSICVFKGVAIGTQP